MPRNWTQRGFRSQLWLGLLLFLAGCGTPRSGPQPKRSATTESSDLGTAQFQCDPKAQPPAQLLRRLTNQQLRYSVLDLVDATFPKQMAASVAHELAAPLSAVPVDAVDKEQPFSSMDQSVSQQHVDSYVHLAQAMAAAFTQSDVHVRELVRCKASEVSPTTLSSGCLTAFMRSFGRLVFRHSLSESEFQFLRASYPSDAPVQKALRTWLVVLFASPQFLYQAERGVPSETSKDLSSQVDAYTLASRLSFHFWQAAPDARLLSLAEDGKLDDEAGLAEVVDRMLEDPRAERSLRTFVSEWFNLASLRELDGLVGDPIFDAFAGEHLPSPDLREAMVGEVLDSFVFHLSGGDAYVDWFRSPYSFARSEELAAIYGVEPWRGGEPPRFPVGTRAGLLTRAALLATGTANTRPIMKGVFIRKRVLCDDLDPPPPNAANVPPQLSSEVTTREVVEALTEQPGTACMSCHRYQINPLGFATEGYDALGRVRVSQRLFSEAGVELTAKPVDTRVVARIARFDGTETNGAGELVRLIADSGKGEACFARQYLRFTYGRLEDLSGDGCLLEAIRKALHEPGGLRMALRAPVLNGGFRRSFSMSPDLAR